MNQITEAKALIVAKGYSIDETDGTDIISGYNVNLEALAEYEAIYGKLTYGALFVNVTNDSIKHLEFENGLIKLTGDVRAVQVQLKDEARNFEVYNYRIGNLRPEEHASLKLVMAAYIVIGDEISFIQSDYVPVDDSEKKDVPIEDGALFQSVLLGDLFKKANIL